MSDTKHGTQRIPGKLETMVVDTIAVGIATGILYKVIAPQLKAYAVSRVEDVAERAIDYVAGKIDLKYDIDVRL